MADGSTVKMKLTFWRDGLKPGDTVDVPADEVHRWKGYAEPANAAAEKAADKAPAKTVTGDTSKPATK
ncbi:hypothetical protein [Streptomyces sp. NPDC086838]|jgi:hypothetical protein|uniref:hypothetical protein n=1 Tax=Streptomyces sp. NPDC086838 TaxID=3365762 RepID=UPI00380262EB